MPVKKLYFDVRDSEYFKRLKDYIVVNYGRYFEIVVEKPEDGGCVTVSDYINRRNRKDLFLIKEEKGDAFKYDKASAICSKLASALGIKTPVSEGAGSTEIVCITSAAGGAGKTTISQAMSCTYASMGNKVLYVNANPVAAGDGIFIENERNSFSMLRYYLGGEAPFLLKALASKSPEKRVDYIVNRRPSADGYITAGEAASLISKTGGSGYDYIVFDLPTYPGEGHMELMKAAVCNLLINTENGVKLEQYRKFLEAGGVSIMKEVENFSEKGEYSVPSSDGIFSKHPLAFWNSISRLCRLTEGGHGQA